MKLWVHNSFDGSIWEEELDVLAEWLGIYPIAIVRAVKKRRRAVVYAVWDPHQVQPITISYNKPSFV